MKWWMGRILGLVGLIVLVASGESADDTILITRIAVETNSVMLDVTHPATPVVMQTSSNLNDWTDAGWFITPYLNPITREIVAHPGKQDTAYFRYRAFGGSSGIRTNDMSGAFYEHYLLRIEANDRHAYTWIWFSDTDGNMAFNALGWQQAWHSLSNTTVFIEADAIIASNGWAKVRGEVQSSMLETNILISYEIPIDDMWGTVDMPLSDVDAQAVAARMLPAIMSDPVEDLFILVPENAVDVTVSGSCQPYGEHIPESSQLETAAIRTTSTSFRWTMEYNRRQPLGDIRVIGAATIDAGQGCLIAYWDDVTGMSSPYGTMRHIGPVTLHYNKLFGDSGSVTASDGENPIIARVPRGRYTAWVTTRVEAGMTGAGAPTHRAYLGPTTSMTVYEPSPVDAPIIAITDIDLSKSVEHGTAHAQGSYVVHNSGTGRLNYRSRVQGQSWVSIANGSGTSRGEAHTAMVLFDTSGLDAGQHDGSIVVEDVDRGDSSTMQFSVTVEGAEPPSIVTPPESVTAAEGEQVTFTVTAEGAVPLHYHWTFDGDTVGTGPSLLRTANEDNAGTYTVVVSNDYGTSSASATLTVTNSQPISGGDPTAISWEEVNARWVKNTYADGAITMSDRTTGLMWVFDASANGRKNWYDAIEHCNNLTYAGHSDWFLPNLEQLKAMYRQTTVFSNVQNTRYWSSTPSPLYAWFVTMGTYFVIDGCRSFAYWVWPCRISE